MRVLVLGAGAQGSACALDLARSQGVEKVMLADVDVSHLRAFLKPHVGKTIEPRAVDAKKVDEVRAAMRGVDAVACALAFGRVRFSSYAILKFTATDAVVRLPANDF